MDSKVYINPRELRAVLASFGPVKPAARKRRPVKWPGGWKAPQPRPPMRRRK